MNGLRRLCDMKCGEKGEITELCDGADIRCRLEELGFVCGTKVECVLHSPLGDPKAFLVRGAVIALRYQDSRCVTVEVI